MTIGELTKIKDYITKQQENALDKRSTTEVGTHPSGTESLGGPVESSGVGPSEQGTQTPAPSEEKPRADFTSEEVDRLVNHKLTEAQFDTLVKLPTNKGNVVEMRAGLAHKDMVVQKRRLDRFIKC